MECPLCAESMRRFGRNRNGSQRYRCDACARTFTDADTRPDDHRYVPADRLAFCLNMLLEGVSVRSTSRLTHTHPMTILDGLVRYGRLCQRFLENVVCRVPVADVQADEIWSFVYCKEKTRQRREFTPEITGDAYCFTALDRTTKMIVAWHLGKRCPADTRAFALKLHRATRGRFQLTTDGFRPYLTAIPGEFGDNIDYATLVKVYAEDEEGGRRYSPPEVVGTVATERIGEPDPARICTSHVERSNLTIRMMTRRFTRLTNAFSKKWENHSAALALFFAFYGFCRRHMTLSTTPAVAAGLADYPWTVLELLNRADSVGERPLASGPSVA